jgi:hypothetical protein
MSLQFEQPFAEMQAGQPSEGLVANDPISDKWVVRKAGGGNVLFVDSISIPNEVASGGVVDVEVDVVNAALVISPSDGDHCSSGGQAGYEYEVTIEPGWTTEETRVNCLDLSADTATHQFSFDAPDSAGTYAVDVTVEGTGTGFSAQGSFEVVVPEDGGSVRPDPDPIDGGDGGSPLPGLPEIGAGTGIAIGGGLALLLVLIIALR